jgi:NAD(P)-dependent dehydrogenase (short-subunit alcohol dehydrogenase family)
MTKHAAVHYGPYNIRVNSIHPGAVNTSMTKDAFGKVEDFKNLTALIPLRRIAEPIQIANVAL